MSNSIIQGHSIRVSNLSQQRRTDGTNHAPLTRNQKCLRSRSLELAQTVVKTCIRKIRIEKTDLKYSKQKTSMSRRMQICRIAWFRVSRSHSLSQTSKTIPFLMIYRKKRNKCLRKVVKTWLTWSKMKKLIIYKIAKNWLVKRALKRQ